jgi:signal transduction histidine kinase
MNPEAQPIVFVADGDESVRKILRVQDTCPGIDPESMEQVFAGSHTTKPGGLGMGLSICRSIIENHSGRLWLTTNDGPGVTFHFTILAHPAKADTEAAV